MTSVHTGSTGTLDDELARETGKKAQDRGVDAVVIEGERDVKTLAVGRIDRVASAGDGVGGKTVAGNVVVNGGICSERVNHVSSFHKATC